MAVERVEFMYRHRDLSSNTGRGGEGSLCGGFRCTLVVRFTP